MPHSEAFLSYGKYFENEATVSGHSHDISKT